MKRGKWVLEQILGTPPPPPPPDVPELEDEGGRSTGTLAAADGAAPRANPSCASATPGWTRSASRFENYDAIGAWRDKDGDFADRRRPATLPDGQTFRGPAELKAILKGKKDLFARCLAEKMLTYALGRGLEYYDTLRRRQDRRRRWRKDDYRFSRLVLEIVKSDPFRDAPRQARENEP